MKKEHKTNPLRIIWNALSIPLGALGLLGLSDSLITFQKNLQALIDSYQSIVYPVFTFAFSWLWFDIPTPVYDYLFLGIMFVSNDIKIRGIRLPPRDVIKRPILFLIRGVIVGVLFWPIVAGEMACQVLRTSPDGIIKSLAEGGKPFYVKYNLRDQDVLVFRYVGAVLLLFVIVFILNYTFFN